MASPTPVIRPAATANQTRGARTILLPISFMLLGLGALLAGMLWLIIEPEAISAFYYAPHTVALTHLFILGFLVSVVMGATYQLVPVALETKLAYPVLGLHHFWLHLVGVFGMVTSFYSWQMGSLAVYGGVVYLGMLLFLFNVVATIRKAPRVDVVGGFILASVIWMSLTMTAGLLIAIHKQFPFLPWPPLALLHAHAHLGFIGIFVMIILGVSLKLVPMFALSEIQSAPRAWWTLALINLGLPLLTCALVSESGSWVGVAAGIITVGISTYGWEMRAIIRTRKRRQIDLGMRIFFAALMMLFLALGCGLLLLLPGLPILLAAKAKTVYALLALLGFVGMAIIGMLHKILPFLVWFRSYSPHIGKAKLPSTGEMFSPLLAKISFGLLLGGLGTASIGAFLADRTIAATAGMFLTAGCLVFLANMGLILRHFLFPQIQPITR